MITLLVVGMAVGVALATRFGVAEPLLVNQAPVLQIHTAPGAQVTVNGKLLMGSSPFITTVPTGSEAIIRVEGSGLSPVEAKVALGANELRVISFNTVSVQPKNK
jgi:hypothetical protein